LSINAEDFEAIRNFLRENSGISLQDGKEYLVEGRLASILAREGFADFGEMIRCLQDKNSVTLRKKVLEAMTTNETSFFRDRHPFETLRTGVLPEFLIKRQEQKKLEIWCAACSSGQEPYSLAMLILDKFPQIKGWNIKIIASDISEEMLERSREGIYSQFEVARGLPGHYVPKFFQRFGSKWEVKQELKEMMEFRQLNLNSSLTGFPPVDILFIRNVLIYFDGNTKKAILKKVKGLLKPDGYLFLGSGENVAGLDDHFEQTEYSTSSCFRLRPN